VIGIWIEVEGEAERFRLAVRVLALLTASGEAERQGEQSDCQGDRRDRGALHPLLSIAK
jgi:hypothetical protein